MRNLNEGEFMADYAECPNGPRKYEYNLPPLSDYVVEEIHYEHIDICSDDDRIDSFFF